MHLTAVVAPFRWPVTGEDIEPETSGQTKTFPFTAGTFAIASSIASWRAFRTIAGTPSFAAEYAARSWYGKTRAFRTSFGSASRDATRPAIPSYDDWQYSVGTDDYDQVNGTENSRNDEAGNIPDSEDLNGNQNLDKANDYFSYDIELSYDLSLIHISEPTRPY